MLVQLGLRPEELFALRGDDVQEDQLRIDEALVEGKIAAVKTDESEAYMYIPPEVGIELTHWLECRTGGPRDWLFQTTHGRPGFLNLNNYRERILQPAAIRAGSRRDRHRKEGRQWKAHPQDRCRLSMSAKNLRHTIRRPSERPEEHPNTVETR
jgi:integrase